MSAASMQSRFDDAESFTSMPFEGYALTSDRKLWLVIQDCPSDDLTPLMAQIVGHPDRAEAVRQTIEQRHYGEAA